MGRLWLVAPLLAACSDPAAKPDAGIDAGDAAPVAGVSITPASFNFGQVDIGTAKPMQTFALQNITAAPVDLTSIAIGGTNPMDFAVDPTGCPQALDPDAICTISVGFDPTAPDLRAAQLEVTAGGVATAYVQGTGIVRSQKLIFEPSSRDFGDVGVGETSAQLSFAVTNEAVASPLTATITPAGSAFSIVSTDCATSTIPLHGTCTVVVQWSPAYSGRHAANLSLAAGSAGSWAAGLVGTSGRPLAITPDNALLGSMLVGQSGPTLQRTFTITNTSEAATGALTATATGADASAFKIDPALNTCTTLASGDSCTVVVELDTSAITTRGGKTGQLVVTDGTTTVVAHAALSGSAYTVYINGDATFPNTTSGQQSPIQTLKVLNPSDTNTGTLGTTLGSQFTITSNNCAAGIAAHTSCAIGVRFTPTSTGAKSADLTVTATGAGGSFTATVTGTGQ